MPEHVLAALRDGALLSVAASALLMITLRLNPRLLIKHFPKEMREAVPPLTPAESRTGRLIGLLLVALLAGGPLVSTLAMAHAAPDTTFADRALHAFVVGMVFNLADWLVLDEFWLGLFRPRWAIPPGAEHIPVRFEHGRHARGFLTGTLAFAVFALLIALATAWA